MKFVYAFSLLCLFGFSLPVAAQSPRPEARVETLPDMAWDHVAEGSLWTRAALAATHQEGRALLSFVPSDIATWCPAYQSADRSERAAFWVGLASALAKHESRWRPRAVGSGKWYGLLQIQPSTARGYGCRAGSGEALKDGPANLTCAMRIWAQTIPRDGVIAARGGGIAADWGPMIVASKREEMAAWVKRQSYCHLSTSLRPQMRVPVTD